MVYPPHSLPSLPKKLREKERKEKIPFHFKPFIRPYTLDWYSLQTTHIIRKPHTCPKGLADGQSID